MSAKRGQPSGGWRGWQEGGLAEGRGLFWVEGGQSRRQIGPKSGVGLAIALILIPDPGSSSLAWAA